MSRKNAARAMAKQAVGDSARVDKLGGFLVVTRTEAKGRLRDWQSRVRKAMKEALPEWEASVGTDAMVFSLPKGRRQDAPKEA